MTVEMPGREEWGVVLDRKRLGMGVQPVRLQSDSMDHTGLQLGNSRRSEGDEMTSLAGDEDFTVSFRLFTLSVYS